MAAATYIRALAFFLLLSGILHIAVPQQTERWTSRPPIVRVIGLVLVLFAWPLLLWRGWYFWTLFVLLVVSGLWRLCFPRHSIRAQQWSYPRWVHGCLLLAGALLVWTLKP